MASKGNMAVVETPKGGVPAPDFMRGMTGQGTEALGAGDYEMPRIVLLQSLSDEVRDNDDLKAGNFYHNLLEEQLAKVVKVVPLFISKRYVLWNPRESGGGILARADDGVNWTPPSGAFNVKLKSGKNVVWKMAPTVAASRLAEWGTSDPDDPNSQPAATQCYVVAVALPEHPEMGAAALFLQRSAIAPARKWMGKLKISNIPTFGQVYDMSSADDQNAAGQKFFNYKFTSAGFVSSEEQFNSYRELYEQFKATGVRVADLEGAGNDATDGAPVGGSASSEKAF